MNKKKTAICSSPIALMGNKYRLLKKGLADLFPEDIDIFVDLFCGSGVVSLNTKANKYFLNDISPYMIDLMTMFKHSTAEDITKAITNKVEQYGLLKGTHNSDPTKTQEYKALAKERYFKLREDYNASPDILTLYTLMFYAFGHGVRFNSSGQYNVPLGNTEFNLEKQSKIIEEGCAFFSSPDVILSNRDYRLIDITQSESSKYFVYADPPYIGTTAFYNLKRGACNGWHDEEDIILLDYLKNLDKHGIKFGLSNTFKNKDFVNTRLIEWVKENNFKVHYFEDFTYYALGNGVANTEEVYIYNY